jgi:pilus assembly protein CpaB
MLRALLAVCILTGVGGFGAVAWMQRGHGTAAAQAAPLTHHILVSAHELRAGALLKATDLAQRDAAAPEPGAIEDTPDERRAITGSMIRRSVPQGASLLPQDLLRPGDHGFLAAVLRPGLRAVTVGVDAVSGSSGLIWPGDHVDVILTQAIDDPALPLARRVAAETVLRNARVIAIDQAVVRGAQPAEHAGPETGLPGGHTVTLEVDATEAERVTVAARIGRLALMVRSADAPKPSGADAAQAASGPVWAGDVSHALAAGVPARSSGVLHLWAGSAEAKEYKF